MRCLACQGMQLYVASVQSHLMVKHGTSEPLFLSLPHPSCPRCGRLRETTQTAGDILIARLSQHGRLSDSLLFRIPQARRSLDRSHLSDPPSDASSSLQFHRSYNTMRTIRRLLVTDHGFGKTRFRAKACQAHQQACSGPFGHRFVGKV